MKNIGSKGEHILQRKLGTSRRASAFYNMQMLDYLNPKMRKFISRQEMVFIATSDSNGECDCSIRAGDPGFVRIINTKNLICPEYRGNGVMASLGNILENQHIGGGQTTISTKAKIFLIQNKSYSNTSQEFCGHRKRMNHTPDNSISWMLLPCYFFLYPPLAEPHL